MIRHRHEDDRTGERSFFGIRFSGKQIRSEASDKEPETDRARESGRPALSHETEKNNDVVSERRIEPDSDVAKTEVRISRPRRINVAAANSVKKTVDKPVVLRQIVTAGHS